MKFRGEHAVGDAGPYRELFSDIGRELQESVNGMYSLPLLIQCPNKQVGYGENRHKFVARCSSTSPLVHVI